MTHDERVYTVRAMKTYGGSFVRALGECMMMADEDNAKKLEAAFADYFAKYGPGSDMWKASYAAENA